MWKLRSRKLRSRKWTCPKSHSELVSLKFGPKIVSFQTHGSFFYFSLTPGHIHQQVFIELLLCTLQGNLLWSLSCRLGLPGNQSLGNIVAETVSCFSMSVLAFLKVELQIFSRAHSWPKSRGHILPPFRLGVPTGSSVIADAGGAWSMSPQQSLFQSIPASPYCKHWLLAALRAGAWGWLEILGSYKARSSFQSIQQWCRSINISASSPSGWYNSEVCSILSPRVPRGIRPQWSTVVTHSRTCLLSASFPSYFSTTPTTLSGITSQITTHTSVSRLASRETQPKTQ